jgi:hypothetical protein
MGFDISKKTEILSDVDRKILHEICVKHNVAVEGIETLLKIEKEYQLKERRFGIYEKLKQVLEAGI